MVGHRSQIVRPLVSFGQLHAHKRLPRIESDGALELPHRFRDLARGEQARSQERMGRDVLRLQADGLTKLLDGPDVVSPPLIHDTQVVVDEGGLAASSKHLLKVSFGLVQTPGLFGGYACFEDYAQLLGDVRLLRGPRHRHKTAKDYQTSRHQWP